jgi:hypothetical protein
MHFNHALENVNQVNDEEVDILEPSPHVAGTVDAGGHLTNGYVRWQRPGGGNGTAVVLWAMVVGNADIPPQRPPLHLFIDNDPASPLQRHQPTNATGPAGNWSIRRLPGGAIGSYHQLVVWLDIESDRCYYRAVMRFEAVAE